jgi:FkbM family methyltransferase
MAATRLREAAGWSTEVHVSFADGTGLVGDLRDHRLTIAMGEVQGRDYVSRWLRDLLGVGDSFLDIGANHAAYSVVAHRIVGLTGRVVAFEPQPALASLARRTFVTCGRPPEDIHEVALADTPGSVALHIPSWNSGSASLYPDVVAGRPASVVKVPVARLDDLMPSLRLRQTVVVKLDVEGAEGPVLAGGESLFSEHPALILEINPWTTSDVDVDRRSFPAIVDVLRGFGYTTATEASGERFSLATLSATPLRNVLVTSA